jgi:hypothetical protein
VADWDSPEKSIARSIRYVRWAQKGDPFYLQFGQLNRSVIGTGILVDNYMNISGSEIRAGHRRLGLAMDMDLGLGGIEALVNDTLQPSVYAGRVYVRPASVVPYVPEKLTLGVSMATDTRKEAPYEQLKATAVDAYYPLHPAFVLYAHVANIEDHGTGKGAGFRGELGPIAYVAEARSLDSDFVPSPFSKGYEDKGIDWLRYPKDGQRTEGYLLGADLNLMAGDLVLSVKQEMNKAAKVQNPRVTGEFEAKGILLKAFTGGRDASVSASYTRELVDPNEGDANEYLKAKATIAVVKGIDINYSYDLVVTPDKEVQRNMSAGVGFGF